jgi:hypothetical protein
MKTPGKRPAFFLSIVERAFPRLQDETVVSSGSS